jgi:hypothetical protein
VGLQLKQKEGGVGLGKRNVEGEKFSLGGRGLTKKERWEGEYDQSVGLRPKQDEDRVRL